VFEWDAGTTSWVQLGADIDGEAAGDGSGYSVSLSANGSRLAVGTPYNDGAATSAGHVRVFDWDAGISSWSQIGVDLDGEVVNGNPGNFGNAVSLSSSGAFLAAGGFLNAGTAFDSGHARIFEWNTGTSAWEQSGLDLDAEAEADQFGFAVAMSGDASTVVVGGNKNDATDANAGHARVFRNAANPLPTTTTTTTVAATTTTTTVAGTTTLPTTTVASETTTTVDVTSSTIDSASGATLPATGGSRGMTILAMALVGFGFAAVQWTRRTLD
jgi:hypothetical protein